MELRDIERDYQNEIKSKIDRSNRLISSKLDMISDLNYEINLLQNDIVSTLKSYLDPFHTFNLYKLWYKFNRDKGEFPAEEKDCMSTMKFIEKNLFFDKDYGAKLYDIICSGYDNHAYEFYYKIGEAIKFTIEVPVFQNASTSNYVDMVYMLCVIDEGEGALTVVKKTDFFSELQPMINSWIQKKLSEANNDKNN